MRWHTCRRQQQRALWQRQRRVVRLPALMAGGEQVSPEFSNYMCMLRMRACVCWPHVFTDHRLGHASPACVLHACACATHLSHIFHTYVTHLPHTHNRWCAELLQCGCRLQHGWAPHTGRPGRRHRVGAHPHHSLASSPGSQPDQAAVRAAPQRCPGCAGADSSRSGGGFGRRRRQRQARRRQGGASWTLELGQVDRRAVWLVGNACAVPCGLT